MATEKERLMKRWVRGPEGFLVPLMARSAQRLLPAAVMSALCVLLLAPAAGARPATSAREATAYPYVFDNADGTQTTINALPTRVVVTEEQPARAVDLLLALGVTPVGAGTYPTASGSYLYENSQDFPAWLNTTGITPVGAFSPPNYEAIAALNPTLIISGSADSSLSAIAPTINVGRGTPWMQLITELAPIFGKQARAANIVARFNQRAATLRGFANGATTVELSPLGDGQNVYVFASGYQGISNTEFSYMMEEAGFKIAAPPSDTPAGAFFEEISDELLPVDVTADYVFVYADSNTQLADFQGVPTYKEMRAAKDGHVYGDDQNVFGAGPIGSSLALSTVAKQTFGVTTTEAVAYRGSDTSAVPIVVDLDVQASTGKACWTVNAAKAGSGVRSVKIMDGSSTVLSAATSPSVKSGCGKASTSAAAAIAKNPGAFTVDLDSANGKIIASAKLESPSDTYPGA
jgi:ABC-type Fe3+-hydroxamate transport system substrate-binding protein